MAGRGMGGTPGTPKAAGMPGMGGGMGAACPAWVARYGRGRWAEHQEPAPHPAVAKLDVLTKKPLLVTLNDEQKAKAAVQLQGLNQLGGLSPEEAKKRLDGRCWICSRTRGPPWKPPGTGGQAVVAVDLRITRQTPSATVPIPII